MTTSPNTVMTLLVEGQKSAATAANTALLILDSAIMIRVLDSSPPVAPPTSGLTPGDIYVVPASATGDWAGKDLQLAVWQTGWTFVVAKAGWIVWDLRNHRQLIFRGASWESLQAARVAELTDSTGETASSTLAPITGVDFSTEFTEIGENFATVNAQINAMMNAMITGGLMAADALSAEIVNETVQIVDVVVDIKNP